MQVYLLVNPSSINGGAGVSAGVKGNLLGVSWKQSHRWSRRTVVASAAINGEQDHYAVLGISSSASPADIKRAYRLLARKYHPDVSKDSQAGEVFKSIRLAYDVLSNEATRAQYDGTLKFQENMGRPWKRHVPEFDEEIRMYRWAELRKQMWRDRYRQQNYASEEDSSSDGETDDMHEEESPDNERGPFSEVLRSAFFTLFLMKAIGSRLSLTLCSLNALLDKKLDAGYKIGYLIAWIIGGTRGILLTLSLSFTSWLCGKTSSSIVAVVVVAMWVGMNLGPYAPLPQGALLTLLYMSIKLHVDLS
ncbi:PREDICTED: dnaJ homolog subfamily C member 18 [Nelumbo nucifera]|uniref:J domain-containing protein n=2 Tax=Nelumbo nucifera TaxID=4432 RepID=A0A822ZK18_NELNU|nr:PREDICTED: dnaJ homolog subfamily C member 18 [Nelumbo nucifera]DAD42078.1 TPA_asm: hypothetical protein HUJ06_000308 [Nelumbo nucifera]